jgi:molecular chaperone GrpE
MMVARKGRSEPGTEKSFDTDFTGNAKDKVEGAKAAAGNAAADAGDVAAVDAVALEALIEEIKAKAELVEEELVAAKSAEEGLAEEELDPLAQAQAEAEEMRDKFMRLQAEWDNYRKRTNLEREQERRRAAQNLVERLLPIVDDLERAIEHADTANEVSLKEGIAAVYNKLNEVLTREGVKVIDPVGEAFNANVHQAVGKQNDPGIFDETVTQVYQKGYEMSGRVLRTAMVVVSEGGPKREPEDGGE